MGIGAYTTTILVVDHGWRDLWTIPLAGVVAGGVRPVVRAAGDPLRRAVSRARDLRDPALVHRAAQALPALHRRQRRQEPASAALRVRSPHEPVGVVLRRRAGRSRSSCSRSRSGSCADASDARCARSATARSPRRRTASRRRRSRQPRSASRPSSAASPAALFAIGITYVNPDTFPIDLSILLLVGIVIGGAGSLNGMLFGALFVEFIRISWGPALLAAGLTRAPHQHAGTGLGLRHLRARAAALPLRRACRGRRARATASDAPSGAGETALLFRSSDLV